jgi:predicted HicB family RNase H-like nuclease
MARPRTYDEPRVTTAFRLTPEMRDELRRTANDEGVSVNQLVVRTLSEYLIRASGSRRRSRQRRAS